MWIAAAIPIVVTSFVIPVLPDTVVLHYNSAWKADGWGSKYMNWLFPALILVITGFWALMIRYYEKKAGDSAARELSRITKAQRDEGFDEEAEMTRIMAENKDVLDSLANAKILAIVALCMAIGFGIMHCALLYNQYSASEGASLMSAVSVGRISNIVLAVIIIITANYMPRASMNSSVGLRISWSMYNETTWNKSNRFAGKVLLVTGILMIITALVTKPLAGTICFLVLLFAAVIISVWYAHRIYIVEKALNAK